MAKAAPVSSTVIIPKMELREAEIRLIGDSPLICHAWSKKAIDHMLDKQMKKAKQAKEAKDPDQDFRDSLYQHPDGGFGFPAVAFKAAAVDATSHGDGITKVEARGAFHITGPDLVKILGPEPTKRQDMVRIAMGTADIRYRGQFENWAVCLPIQFNASVLSIAQITHLFDLAGFGIGVGEWRPQKDGMFGRFHVAKAGEFEELVDEVWVQPKAA